jgi:hypothetical protein
MFKQTFGAERSIIRHNEGLLKRAGQCGGVLWRAYQVSIDIDPRVRRTLIVPRVEEGSAFMLASPACDSDSKLNEVHIRLDRREWEPRVRKTFLRNSHDQAVMAKAWGIENSQFSPEAYYVAAFAHEIGHTSDLHKYHNLTFMFMRKYMRQMETLPFGATPVSVLEDERSYPHRAVKADLEAGMFGPDFKTMEDIYGRQLAAYRELPIEASADRFARHVLATDPLILEDLAA